MSVERWPRPSMTNWRRSIGVSVHRHGWVHRVVVRRLRAGPPMGLEPGAGARLRRSPRRAGRGLNTDEMCGGNTDVGQRILVLGVDGYLGWPTAMACSRPVHPVAVVDNFAKRQWELELGVRPLFHIPTLHERVRAWREVTENDSELFVGDLTDYAFVESIIDGFRPDTVVHYGEQPSAPYSMIDVRHATYTQSNNVVGNLNVLFAIRDRSPDTPLVKLATMGEHRTPDIHIGEGYPQVSH